MMMECNIGILLASHGEYCHGAKNSLEMIIGDCPDLLCVSVTPSMNNEDVQVQMREAYELLKKECSEVLIFTDLLCGSPYQSCCSASDDVKGGYNCSHWL